MEERKIKVGDIVIIPTPKQERKKGFGFNFWGKQAEVMSTDSNDEDGPIGLRFPPWYKYLLDFPNKQDSIIYAREEEIKLCRRWENPQDKEETDLERFWHLFSHDGGTNTPNFPFERLTPRVHVCMMEGCGKQAFCFASYNIWGTICTITACKNHAEIHGTWTDGYRLDERFIPYYLSNRPLTPGYTKCMRKRCNEKAFFDIGFWKREEGGKRRCVAYVCKKHAICQDRMAGDTFFVSKNDFCFTN